MIRSVPPHDPPDAPDGPAGLVDEMIRIGARFAASLAEPASARAAAAVADPVTAPRPAAGPVPVTAAAPIAASPPAPVVVPTRPDVVIVRVGPVVVKAHAPGADEAALRPRMRVGAHPALGGALLAPLSDRVLRVADRLVTVWPAGEPVDPEAPAAAPWEAGARLLARLHAVRSPKPLPSPGGPARVARTVARLTGDGPAETTVRQAFETLPPEARGAAPYPGTGGLTHGDWHLGQLVRHPPGFGEWLLIDTDDLGVGDQAWDLARPAAWFAAGLLAPEVWDRFLSAYLAAGGPALASAGDPWARLDVPARALTVQLAAAAIAAARRKARPLDEVEEILVESCRRIILVSRRPP